MADDRTATPEAHAGTAHPAVMSRLLEDMDAMANNAAQAAAASFAVEPAWGTLCRLRDELRVLADEAELHRPVTYL